METQVVPVYSQEEQRRIRLDICKLCPASACNSNFANKCQINDLVCTKDNNKLVVIKSQNLTEKCPLNSWDMALKTKTIIVPSKGCGCGK